MDRSNRRRIISLLILTLPTFAYIIIASKSSVLTGQNRIDGIIGVLLGLYMCSLAAADLVDMLFTRWPRISKVTSLQWLAINSAFVLLGIAVIIVGTTRFTTR
jgi:hypothetical protein